MLSLIKYWQVLLVFALLLVSFLYIHPNFDRKGVKITFVKLPASNYLKRGVIITEINGKEVKDVYGYNKIVSEINPGDIVRIKYKEEIFPYLFIEKEANPFVAINDTNKLGIAVEGIKSTNLKFGLDLEGGIRVFLKPEKKISREDAQVVLQIIERRLNVYGLKEIDISYFEDFSGNQYFKIEVSGMSKEEIESLLSKKGNFEAKIGNVTVFTGDDIIQVCPLLKGQSSCFVYREESNNIERWKFVLGLQISEKAAKKMANVTSKLSIGNCYGNECYLNETISFYLDGKPIENSSLLISANLKGVAETTPSITGARGSKEEAEREMNRLKAILQSKQLPVKLEIARYEEISPKFSKFVKDLFFIFILAIIIVDVIIAIRYRHPKIIAIIIFATLSELLISLGISAALNVTLDIGAIAGLIASVATGIDDQILMTDEAIKGKKKEQLSIKERIKEALQVIITDFFTTIAALFPLLFSSAGLLRGFAIMEILNSTVGTFITRPAYSKLLEKIIK